MSLELRFSVPAAASARLASEMARGDGMLHHLPASPPDVPSRLSPDAQFMRRTRRIRTGAAVVALVFDEVCLQTQPGLPAPAAGLPLRLLTMRLQAGPVAAMLALAERWRRRFGLALEPRGLAERGAQLVQGAPTTVVRRARPAAYPRRAAPEMAFVAVFDECLDQVLRNAAALGDPGIDGELQGHLVHQLRVGIRRLRSVFRCFDGVVPAPPDALQAGLRRLFAELGAVRDADVLDAGVAAELARAGAPALQVAPGDRPAPAPAPGPAPGPAAIVAAPASQQCLLGWVAWRAHLPPEPAAAGGDLRRHARRRLRRWHARIAADGALFDTLDDASVHALRKRIKRLRYGIEFFAPLLPRRAVARYAEVLVDLQERMGRLNDLMVARERYQALVADDTAAWFALGWLAARIAGNRTAVRPALERLGRLDPPVG